MSHRRRGAQAPKFVRLYGRHAVAAALANPERLPLRLYATREAAAALGPPPGVQIQWGDMADLGKLIPADAAHQGLVLEVEPLPGEHLEDLLLRPGNGPLVVLDQVTDPGNVGAIMRSSAAFGAVGVVTQDRHAPPESGALAKAASGALEVLPWARVVNLARALDQIAEAGFWRIGLDGRAQRLLEDALGTARPALVLGAEGEGMRPNTAAHVDELARLPIGNAVESLNVSTAAACALYACARRA
ncbi:MAG: RNA methyltransferase [Sphingomonadaceae bacterium]|nr:RNA methyltransferase [Sphingomonadaceae bacterium]